MLFYLILSLLCWLQKLSYTPCTREKQHGNPGLRGTSWVLESRPQQATCVITSINQAYIKTPVGEPYSRTSFLKTYFFFQNPKFTFNWLTRRYVAASAPQRLLQSGREARQRPPPLTSPCLQVKDNFVFEPSNLCSFSSSFPLLKHRSSRCSDAFITIFFPSTTLYFFTFTFLVKTTQWKPEMKPTSNFFIHSLEKLKHLYRPNLTSEYLIYLLFYY